MPVSDLLINILSVPNNFEKIKYLVKHERRID